MDCEDASGNEGDTKGESTRRKRKVVVVAKTEVKPGKRGVVYISTIPKFMNVTMIRDMFSVHGEVGRVYLQLNENETKPEKRKKRKRAIKHFVEGWVEFVRKKDAKYIAKKLNKTQISNQKRSKFYDELWNIKYLKRFKWFHLSERLAYERAVHKQRLLTEIAQAKREVNFFSYNVDRSKKLRKLRAQGKETVFELPEIKQRDTDSEIRSRKAEAQKEDRTEFLKSMFGQSELSKCT